MTLGRGDVRVLLYGCSHKPRFSGMGPPKKGDTITCAICRRSREVIGIESGNAGIQIECRGSAKFNCPWKIVSKTMSAKRIKLLAKRHANAQEHTVVIVKDGYEFIVKPQKTFAQPTLDVALWE